MVEILNREFPRVQQVSGLVAIFRSCILDDAERLSFRGEVPVIVPSVAVVGATGAVGEIMRHVLVEHNFPLRAIKFLASERSAGKTIDFQGKKHTIELIRPEAFAGIDIVLSSTPAG